MPPNRLPIVDSDDGVWGDILRQYLMKEHYNNDTDHPDNGGHQFVTIRPGTTSAAPLTLSPGPLRTVPAIGAIEFNGDTLYFTQATGTVRKRIATYSDSGALGDIYYRDTDGHFARLPIGSTSHVLTVSGGMPSWQAPSAGSTTFSDTAFTLQDNGNATKQAKFELSGLTAGETRIMAVPDANTTLVGTDVPQILTGKTLTSPVLTTPRIANGGSINDTNGNELIAFTANSSAVNEIGITSAATGGSPIITAQGSDPNVNLVLGGKGTGQVTLRDGTDITKAVRFNVSSIPTGTVRVLTLPNVTGTIYATGGTDVSVADGGTGRSTSTTAYGIIAAGTTATGAQQTIAPGTAGQFLKSAGASALASFANITAADITGTTAEFNAALSDNDFATQAGIETLTGKTIDLSNNNVTGTMAQFNDSIADGRFAGALSPTAVQTSDYTAAAWELVPVDASGGTVNVTLPTAPADGTQVAVTKADITTGNDVLISCAGSAEFVADGSTTTQLAFSILTGVAGFGDHVVVQYQSSNDVWHIVSWLSGKGYATLTGAQTLENKTLLSPRINTILDANGAASLELTATAGAVNHLRVVNREASSHPYIETVGSDSNINLGIVLKGAGRIQPYQQSGTTHSYQVLGTEANINVNLIPKGAGTVQANFVDVATVSGAQTLTNKRINPRTSAPSIAASYTINSDTTDFYTVTGQNQNVTFNDPTGVPVDGQKMMIRIKDDGTARTVGWSAKFQASGVAAPLAQTVPNREHNMLFVYSTGVSKWVCLAADAVGY